MALAIGPAGCGTSVNPACVQPPTEIRMGLFFSARSWRAPLQLIDCWLPSPGSSARKAGELRPTIPSAEHTPSPVVQRFTRAGWLGRPAANAPRLDDPTDPPRPTRPTSPTTQQRCAHRSEQTSTRAPRSSGARVVLSGRMDRVCAELDRLAEQEALQEAMQRAA